MQVDPKGLEAAIQEADRFDTGVVSRAGKTPVYMVVRRDDSGEYRTVSEHASHTEARDAMERAMFEAAILAYFSAAGEGRRSRLGKLGPCLAATVVSRWRLSRRAKYRSERSSTSTPSMNMRR